MEEEMVADFESIDLYSEEGGSEETAVLIFEDKVQKYNSSDKFDESMLDTSVLTGDKKIIIIDNMAVKRVSFDKFDILIIDSNFKYFKDMLYDWDYTSFWLLFVIVIFAVIVIILLTNRMLTYFVFKRITAPLELLVFGVHQLRDGNLEYRIEYKDKDEFAEVCREFNEMAEKLLESVNARQKGEENRKELIAGISHDIRTPLTSIKAYLEGLEKGVATTPTAQKHYLQIIKRKTDELEEIVNQLFLFSKIDIGDFPFYSETVDIGIELERLVTSLKNEYEDKGLIITLGDNIKNIKVEIDIVQFRNVITNVLENSVKYKENEIGHIKVFCWDRNDVIIIGMEDDGPGVPEEAVDKLFDVFYRSDPSRNNKRKGSGLGLAIAERIIDQFSGHIWAINLSSGGLGIYFEIPKLAEGKKSEKNTDCGR